MSILLCEELQWNTIPMLHVLCKSSVQGCKAHVPRHCGVNVLEVAKYIIMNKPVSSIKQ